MISINVLLMVNIEIRHAQDTTIKALNYSAARIAFKPFLGLWSGGMLSLMSVCDG